MGCCFSRHQIPETTYDFTKSSGIQNIAYLREVDNCQNSASSVGERDIDLDVNPTNERQGTFTPPNLTQEPDTIATEEESLSDLNDDVPVADDCSLKDLEEIVRNYGKQNGTLGKKLSDLPSTPQPPSLPRPTDHPTGNAISKMQTSSHSNKNEGTFRPPNVTNEPDTTPIAIEEEKNNKKSVTDLNDDVADDYAVIEPKKVGYENIGKENEPRPLPPTPQPPSLPRPTDQQSSKAAPKMQTSSHSKLPPKDEASKKAPDPEENDTCNNARLDSIYCDVQSRGDVYVTIDDFVCKDYKIPKHSNVTVIDKSKINWSILYEDDTGENVCADIPGRLLIKTDSHRLHSWYYEGADYQDVEKNLESAEIGSFYVRESQTKGGYTLTILDKQRKIVKHAITVVTYLSTAEEHFYIYNYAHFKSLPELVNYYKDKTHLSATPRDTGFSPAASKSEREEGDITSTGTDDHASNECNMDEQNGMDMHEEELNFDTRKGSLGKGSYGEVYEGTFKGKPVAVKYFQNISGHELPKEYLKEIEVMVDLKHKHLVNFYGFCKSKQCIVTELMPNGDLKHYLKTNRKTLTRPDLMLMAFQVSDGMCYLEEKSIIHRDLAARNILVGKNSNVKIADFGLARNTGERGEYQILESRIPYKWSPPEAFKDGKVTSKGDVWCFGVLLVEILTFGGDPYPGKDNKEVKEMVTNNPIEIHWKMDEFPEDFYNDIMKECWMKEPNKRPTFRNIRTLIKLYQSSKDERP